MRPLFAPPAVAVRREEDGCVYLESPVPLAPYERSLGAMLARWAAAVPDRTFLAERDPRDSGGGWRTVTWGEAGRVASAIGQALLDRGLGPERPVVILSGNGVDHALLTLGALVAGVPVVPVSVAY